MVSKCAVSKWSVSYCSADPPHLSPTTATAISTVGVQLTISLLLAANLAVDNIALTKNGVPVTDTRFTVTATSLPIVNVTPDDSGVY